MELIISAEAQAALDAVVAASPRDWKLTPRQVIEIYRRARDGESKADLAQEFGLHASMVYVIKTRGTPGYRAILDVAHKHKLLDRAPRAVRTKDEPVKPCTLFTRYPDTNILRYAMRAGRQVG